MRGRYQPPNLWQPVGKILQETLRELHLEKGMNQGKIWVVWEEAVGKTIAQVAKPESIRFKTLYVNVTDSVWLHQLSCYHDLILNKVNAQVGVEVINKIRFRLGG
jgi:predicted nucleic acid-binding Zn ribbon protein